TRDEAGERRRGVVFIREVAPRWAVCTIARRVYNEQYVCCAMTHVLRVPGEGLGRVAYRWRRPTGWLELGAQFGQPARPSVGSEAEFITEHYWGYSRQRDGSTMEYRVEH